jgi:hypothetical protein
MPISILLVNLFYPERHPTIGFPINVESLVGDLKGEFGDAVDVAVLDMQQPGVTIDTVLETARRNRCDIVGVSVKTGQREIAEGILEGLLAFPAADRPRYLMVGGYRPRVYHEEFAEKYPSVLVCIGEGEPTMRGMIEHLRGSLALEQVPNLIFMRDGQLQRTERRQHDLRNWHPPGDSTLQFVLDSAGVVYLETSRGCSWEKCTFCSRKFSAGTKPSTIPADKLAAAWAAFNRRGVRYVYCSDEDFLMNSHAHGLALGEALVRNGVGIEFWVQTTVDGVLQLGRASHTAGSAAGTAGRRLNVLDADLLEGAAADLIDDDPVGRFDGAATLATLKKAGLRRIFFGLESGSASQLLRYRKGVTAEEGGRAVELCRELGLDVEVGFIPLDPLATLDELRETVAFVKAHNLAQSAVKVLNVMCIQNGVAMFAKTKQAGLLSGERDVDTFLYPYTFADRRVGEVAEWLHNWNRHGLSEFTYALRRLVDGDPANPVATSVLRELRQLEFDFLALLVDARPEDDSFIFEQCMQLRFDIMRRCMDAVDAGRMSDPKGFLGIAFEDSREWMAQGGTADVLRL